MAEGRARGFVALRPVGRRVAATEQGSIVRSEVGASLAASEQVSGRHAVLVPAGAPTDVRSRGGQRRCHLLDPPGVAAPTGE